MGGRRGHPYLSMVRELRFWRGPATDRGVQARGAFSERGWSTEGDGKSERHHLRRRHLAVAVVFAVVAFLTASSLLFVWPATNQPRHVDGIVSLNGTDEPAREKLAVSLAERGYAPVLLFSQGPTACPRVARVKVVCFYADPERTIGEVRFAADYAKRHGWQSLLIVAGRAQVTRARLLMKRCFSGEVVVVPAPFQLLHFPFEVIYEWGALARALFANTGC